MAEKKKKAPAKPKPIIGYGASVSAGKKVTQQVKKNVRKGVVSAARKAGRQAAKGTGRKTYTAGQMENRGRGGQYLVAPGTSKEKAKYIAQNYMPHDRYTNTGSLLSSKKREVQPLPLIEKAMQKALGSTMRTIEKAITGKNTQVGKQMFLSTHPGTRKIKNTPRIKNPSLYEKTAYKAYSKTKKRMATKGKKK